jgi:hypothetical protein
MSVSSAPSAPAAASVPAVRGLALTGALGGALTAASGVVSGLVVGPASTVAPDRWSYPWTPSGLVVASAVYAVLHLMVVAGLVALHRSGLAGLSRAARGGLVAAGAGLVVLAVAELASIPFATASVDEAGGVGAVFGLANLVTAAGLVVAGVATARAGRWPGWGRWTLLVSGIALVLVLPLPTVSAELLALGVAAWGVATTVFGAALATAGRR